MLNDFSFASFELSKNCRSTRRIADFFTRASRIEPMAFNAVDGMKVCLRTYSNNEEQSELLAKTVKELMKEGIPIKDMVVISHMGRDNPNSCISDLSPLKGVCSHSFIASDSAYEPIDGLLQITTVQRFKGLEAKVVIVVDVYKLEDEDKRAQMRNYTSFSRAKTHLYVLAHNDMKKELARIINDVG